MSSTTRNRGFTLLELLVALGLMAVLVAALYGTYFSLMKGRDRALAVAEESRELRTTLDGLRRELAAAWYKTSADPDKPLFRFVVEDRDFFGKPASILSFTTIAPPATGSAPLSDQQQVEYRPVARDEAMYLSRRAGDVYLKTDPLPYRQMERLDAFLVECYDGNKWVKSWDARLNGGRLPQLVRVTIRMTSGGKPASYSAVVAPRLAS